MPTLKKYARTADGDGIVLETFTPPLVDGTDVQRMLDECFYHEVAALFREIPADVADHVAPGWKVEAGVWTAPTQE